MNELYWITRLDAIRHFLLICAFAPSLIALVILYLVSDPEDTDGSARDITITFNWIKRFICSIPLFLLLVVFIPSTKDGLLIYGLGETVNYIKANDTAKNLPDKAIKALDIYLDKLNEEKTEK